MTKGNHLSRFDKVAKGLNLNHSIKGKLANFIHYEVTQAKLDEKKRLEEIYKF